MLLVFALLGSALGFAYADTSDVGSPFVTFKALSYPPHTADYTGCDWSWTATSANECALETDMVITYIDTSTSQTQKVVVFLGEIANTGPGSGGGQHQVYVYPNGGDELVYYNCPYDDYTDNVKAHWHYHFVGYVNAVQTSHCESSESSTYWLTLGDNPNFFPTYE